MFKQIRNGSKTVTTAGTRVTLTTAKTLAKNLYLKAPAANAGVVYIGDSSVTAANGYGLAAGETVSLKDLFSPAEGEAAVIDLLRVYADAATNGDKVNFLYFEDYPN